MVEQTILPPVLTIPHNFQKNNKARIQEVGESTRHKAKKM